jgi:anti-sigma factor RsiW
MEVALARPVGLATTHVAGETLSAYFDGELPVEDRRRVEEHVRDCAACRATLRDYRGASALLHTLATRQVPEQLGPDLLQRLPKS